MSKLFFLGSLPHETPEEAIAFVKKYSAHLPFLPQLAESNPHEDMIGQVLRGIELGHWDDKASSCLELFQNEFADAPRCKIQLAGPMGIARTIGEKFEKVVPQWLSFWKGLSRQFKQGGFTSEFWLQLDEPFWSKTLPLSEGYEDFLSDVRSIRPSLRLGLHSCAIHRPQMAEELFDQCDFFSFDFLNEPMSEAEAGLWREQVESGTDLVLGILEKEKPADSQLPRSVKKLVDKLWLSTPCGLYGWKVDEIESSIRSWLV